MITNIESKKIGLRIVMDTAQIFPDDPGNGQPVYVETYNGKYSASWNCANETGELGLGDFMLSDAQLDWLALEEQKVDAWMRANHV